MTQSETKEYDLIVIGGGSGGLGAARRAAEYGAKCIVFEEGRMGGTCVNVGCVPKKLMWCVSNTAQIIHNHSKHYGFNIPNNVTFDMKGVKERRDNYIKFLNGIYERNVEKAKIDLVRKHCTFVDSKTVTDGEQKYTGKYILIAVGSYPYIPESIEGKEHLWTSDDFFNKLDEIPKKTCVVGAGYIAVELSQVLQELGSKVTIMTRGKRPLRHFDRLISCGVTETMLHDGIDLQNNTNIKSVTKEKDGTYTVNTKEGKTFGGYNCVISAIGRGPLAKDLGLQNTKVKQDKRHFIISDEWEQTDDPGIFALGDINNKMQLTPVAIRAGRKFSDRVFGNKKNAKMDYKNVPTVIFSHPPVGTVGLSEKDARKQVDNKELEGPITVYESHFRNLLYGLMPNEVKKKTHMKIVCAGKNERVVGLHMIGEGCDEMLQGFGVAIKMGATKDDFDNCTAIHPTGAEELVTMKKPRGDKDDYEYNIGNERQFLS